MVNPLRDSLNASAAPGSATNGTKRKAASGASLVKAAKAASADGFGVVDSNQRRIRAAISSLGVRLEYDEFSRQEMVYGLEGYGPFLIDAAVSHLRFLCERPFGTLPDKTLFQDVVSNEAMTNRVHPVRKYLSGLKWDGVGRLDGWLTAYCSAADSDYTRAVGSITLIAAVRRVQQPGVKFDEMLVLESTQGTLKSTALRTLATHDEWFNDDLPLNADAKRMIEATSGKWICEAAELSGMRKGDIEALKAALSRSVDIARLAYSRLPEPRPRQFIIIGTTNATTYLKDKTGNRRFWPVKVGAIDIDALKRDRDQLWAEAAQRERLHESIRLDPKLYPDAGAAQAAREQQDPFEEAIAPVFGDKDIGVKGKVRGEDIWMMLGKQRAGDRNQSDMERLGETMRRLGFDRIKRRFGGIGPEWCYVRGTKDEQENRIVLIQTETGWEARVDDGPAASAIPFAND